MVKNGRIENFEVNYNLLGHLFIFLETKHLFEDK